MNGSFQRCLKWFVIHFIPVPGHAHSIQTGPGTSLCSCSGLSLPSRPHSLFLLTIPKQDQESLSAPCPYCLCQAGASSRSVGTLQTQDCYTWSWSCKSWIFYGSFTVRWGPTQWISLWSVSGKILPTGGNKSFDKRGGRGVTKNKLKLTSSRQNN